MLHVSKYCRFSSILSQVKPLLEKSSKNLMQNGPLRTYMSPVLRNPKTGNNWKIPRFLRKSGTIAAQFNANISTKGQKAVGYWLLTCSGMVFVAVVLGITVTYFFAIVCICMVLEEVIKRTVR